jgi:peptide/nickel transport system permease protein
VSHGGRRPGAPGQQADDTARPSVAGARKNTSHWRTALSRLLGSRRVGLALTLLGSLAFLAIFADLLAAPAPLFATGGAAGTTLLPAVVHPERYAGKTDVDAYALHSGQSALWPPVRYGVDTVSSAGALAPSSRAHPLGTDAAGHDLLARSIYGARTALGVALGAVLLGMLLGVVLGGLAGYSRGFWNDRLVRLVETVDTFPAIVVIALVRAIEERPSALSLVIAVACVRWAEVARLVRAEVLRASSEDYVVAARALGARPLRVFWRHMLPNALAPVMVSSVFGVAATVLLETAVSFLALGPPLEAASWGETLAQGARTPGHVRLIVLPGLLLLVTVGGSYLLADAMRDAFDPRTVRRRADEVPRSPFSVA